MKMRAVADAQGAVLMHRHQVMQLAAEKQAADAGVAWFAAEAQAAAAHAAAQASGDAGELAATQQALADAEANAKSAAYALAAAVAKQNAAKTSKAGS